MNNKTLGRCAKMITVSLLAAVSALTVANASDSGSFEVIYGQVNADGTLVSSSGNVTTSKTGTGVINYDFSPHFQHSAVVMFTPVGVTNHAVRIVKNQHENRKATVQSDSYDLQTTEGKSPKQTDTAVSFIALAKTDSGHSSKLVQADQAQLATFRMINGRAQYSANIDGANTTHNPGSGIYNIKFVTNFADTPGIVADYNGTVDPSQQGCSGGCSGGETLIEPVRSISLSNISNSGVTVSITDETGSPADADFTLIAIGKAAQGATTGLLSQATIKYGRYEKTNHQDKTFGEGVKKDTKTSPASYSIPFDNDFASAPYMVGEAEHSSESHLRQVQVSATKSTATLQIAGRHNCCTMAGGNDARFDILAILPN